MPISRLSTGCTKPSATASARRPAAAIRRSCAAHAIDHDKPVTIEGEGGPLTFEPLPQIHGDIISLGFRIGDVAYCPDVSHFPPPTAARLRDLDLLVIDALQHKPHPSHLSVPQTLEWIAELKPRRALLTHMHVPLDYVETLAMLPPGVEPSYDGLAIEFPFKSS